MNRFALFQQAPAQDSGAFQPIRIILPPAIFMSGTAIFITQKTKIWLLKKH